MVFRFETVVEQLKSQDADGLWVSLGSCDIHDASIATVLLLARDLSGCSEGLAPTDRGYQNCDSLYHCTRARSDSCC